MLLTTLTMLYYAMLIAEVQVVGWDGVMIGKMTNVDVLDVSRP